MHVPGFLKVSGYVVSDLESVYSCRNNVVNLCEQLGPSADHDREQSLKRIVITLHQTLPH